MNEISTTWKKFEIMELKQKAIYEHTDVCAFNLR